MVLIRSFLTAQLHTLYKWYLYCLYDASYRFMLLFAVSNLIWLSTKIFDFSDEELIQAEDKLEESKQLAEQAMYNLLSNDVCGNIFSRIHFYEILLFEIFIVKKGKNLSYIDIFVYSFLTKCGMYSDLG
ncbi:unnamed protein product [Brugia timori]|uniref:Uncharacterized protein n=1 Tax=Brugia timori TaxID=42155 RepID=A0A3P7T8Q4_9BILA|nr:unnamed protein product [Brugia timori]